MVSFPNCKINLGLNITGKRADGYHELETVFLPVPINDALEVIQSSGANGSSVTFTTTGLSINDSGENNLCVKAYHLLKNDFPQLPPVNMHLHKAIPMGAGLGGGSADGAFTLVMLDKKFRLNLSTGHLIQYAMKLGSDCPFFILNKPCFATGRGEILNEIPFNLLQYKLLIVNPGIHINTAWAFSQVQPKTPAKKISEIILQPVETWKEVLLNDFEIPVTENYPGLKNIKKQLYKNGAVYASITGSGSSFFGIFASSQKIRDNIFPPNYFIKETVISPDTK